MNKICSKKRYKTKVKIKILPPFICKICGIEFKSASGIASHLLNKHNGMLYQDYLLNYLNIDVDKINIEWDSKRGERKILKSIRLSNAQSNLIGTKKERLSTEQYENFRKSMIGVFSLPWFIKKYGDVEGNIKYCERSENTSKKSYFRKYNLSNKNNWSPISQELFWKICEKLTVKYNKIYFGEFNHEFSCGIHACNFDFVVEDVKKIIEFNGDKFHANPQKYKSSDIPLKFINRKAEDIWKEDEIKIQKAKDGGYDIKIVWESEYIENKENVILKCVNFIENECAN
jgi:hypothetical protein